MDFLSVVEVRVIIFCKVIRHYEITLLLSKKILSAGFGVYELYEEVEIIWFDVFNLDLADLGLLCSGQR